MTRLLVLDSRAAVNESCGRDVCSEPTPVEWHSIGRKVPRIAAVAFSTALIPFSDICAAGDLTHAAASRDYERRDSESPSEVTNSDALGLQEIVVTASTVPASKMSQSLSVSTLSAQQLLQTVPTNSAEALRAIPGVRSESSGGEGNANLTVRGLPISAGGARYVQFQEDGLPVLQFGDIAFGTPDQFLRIDSGLERLEVVRGGSASTLATSAPGGVVNVIANTGQDQAGMIGLSTGLDFPQQRIDFNVGQPFGDGATRFFVSGFYRQGESPRDAGVDAEQGGQLKGNLTHEFSGGYVRVNVKHLDDQVPMAMPVPVSTANGKISTLAGIDPRTASFYSPYWGKDQTLDGNNGRKLSDVNDGLRVRSDAVGIEANFDLSNGFSVEDKFRISDNRGRFISIFPADNGYTTGPFRYATGPNAGSVYNGAVFTATVFNVSIDDLGNTVNDLKLKKNFELSGESELTLVGGWYYSVQAVALTWQFNQYLLALDGSKPALISNASTSTTTPGLIAFGTDVWGGCCVRHIDAEYTTTSPYVSLAWRSGDWAIDGSVRRDNQDASGSYNLGVSQHYLDANKQKVDYSVDKTAYSVGVNYQVDPDLALFLRNSEGYAFNADRIMFNGFALDGSLPIPVNKVQQTEGGVKWRYDDFSAFATYFSARTKETNYEATTQVFTNRLYAAQGVELELAYAWNNFRVSGGATFTDVEISKAETASLEGKTPRRQADWIYQVMPSYTLGPIDFGAAFIGSAGAWGDDSNTIKMPGYTIVNAFINYHLDEHTVVSLSANNLTDKLAYTEVEGDGHAARALNGRSVVGAVKYFF